MIKRVRNEIYSVGNRDWDLRKMHSDLYATHFGTSYNSYLIKDEKTVLIDTVEHRFAEEFIENLNREGILASLDLLVVCHAEPDHSGALTRLMDLRPDLPIYCSNNGIESIKGHYGDRGWDMRPMSTGARLSIGKNELVFINASMLHWPDTMFVYLTGEEILFSNDGFGQHLASSKLFDDEQGEAVLFAEALKYYVNILTPFSAKVTEKIAQIKSMNLPFSMICPSHGVIWRKNIEKILDCYLTWASGVSEDRIAIVYDSMWTSTLKLAEAMADGIWDVSPDTVIKMLNTTQNQKSDILTEIFRAKAVMVGSPTVNNAALPSIVALLSEIKGLQIKNKNFASFGSYGWSGEAPFWISQYLSDCEWSESIMPVRCQWQPDAQSLIEARASGARFAALQKNKEA